MRILAVILSIMVLLSCNTKTEVKAKDLKETELTPDFKVALKFINDYAEYCISNSPTKMNWIEHNQLITSNFKTTYKNLLDSADKADPEMGLDCDPIFDAQDFPDKGFEIMKYDKKIGYITVRGKDWKEFILVMKVIKKDNKWLVDGSGMINIPTNKRAKR